MGIQGTLVDLSSDSIPLLFLALIASFIGNLRSYVLGFLHSIGLTRFDPDDIDPTLAVPHVGSGLSGLVVLAEQLNLSRTLSYEYSCCSSGGESDGEGGIDCMVCLCTLRDGEQVRKLDCRHVFHKECLDGWLHHLNFNCPLCRSPLVSDERVSNTRQRVGGDLVGWFSLH
ncbi:E3 ubiquitin-protein ligase RHA2A [Melia azedarach]|uniref:E3 ubiquitin-protein ligase RHA2A n=1 Tax=Melia azedarach TaxID=155640 RepID=A0ACC1XHK6_MELAZ|nr:E3 ubiquitin-protein ligase RHA2A [Melia azedarach]